MENQPQEIEGIKVTDSIKYLGLTIDNKKNYFKTQKRIIIEKAQKLANTTYCVIAKSCNKLMIGKTFWKSVALPSILYGTRIINLTDTEINEIQRIENGVYRQILGAPKYAPVCSLRGELGASSMRRRIINDRLQYTQHVLKGKNQLLKKVLELMREQNMNWAKSNRKYLEEIGSSYREAEVKTIGELKEKTRLWDTEKWREEKESKTSLTIYNEWKKQIQEETVYDNKPSSVIWFKARTNCLPLKERKRFINENTKCDLCEIESETLEHFMLRCPEYSERRSQIIELQQPYIENTSKIIGNFLFNRRSAEQKKEHLYSLWKIREQKIKELDTNTGE